MRAGTELHKMHSDAPPRCVARATPRSPRARDVVVLPLVCRLTDK